MPTNPTFGKENGKISTKTQARAKRVAMRRASLWLGLCLLGCDAEPQVTDSASDEVRNPRALSPVADSAAVAMPTAVGLSPERAQHASPHLPAHDSKVSPGGPAPSDAPRVYAKSRNVWVRSGPSSELQWLGMLWFGGSVQVRSSERVSGHGCGGSWVPVEPRGWVCVDTQRATLDANDPTYRALLPFRARVETPTPHRYAWINRDIRRFESLAHAEPFLKAWGTRKGGTFGHPAPTLPELPSGLSERRDHIYARSAFAYAADGDYLETGLLLGADLSWVARSDVELLPEVTFQGVQLGGELQLPLAFFKSDDAAVYERRSAEEFVRSTSPSPPRLSHQRLEGPPVTVGKASYYQLHGNELWVRRGEVVVIDPREPFPREFSSASSEPQRNDSKSVRPPTWIEISILGGWLLAYEGAHPVYATLISAGRGGLPVPGKELISTASTPTGRFFVTGKFKTATMESSSGPIVHGDVPWTQNFSGPHAIHGAYWHDEWGKLKSAGCVNVSPRDGQWLFEFTEPRVPEGWHGVRHHSRYGEATLVVLHD